MSLVYLVSGVLALVLFLYLLIALFLPERF
jgi:K+-transporting ATPase KdpF subunit